MCAVIKWPVVGPGVECKRTVSCLLLSTRDWMTGCMRSDAVVVEHKRTVSRLLFSTRDWMTGHVCSDAVVVERKRTVSRLLLSTGDWIAGRVCSDQMPVVAQWCWTQKNRESLALINQRLNDWPCVQWCGCCWTVAYSYQPETEWLAVCAVIKLPANCPVVLNAKEPWVACSYQPETEWLAACAVIKWPGCGWCWTQKKRVGWSFITSILLSPNLTSACPTQILHRMFYSRTAFKCLSLWTILILIQATEHMADPKLMSALFCQSAVNYPNLVNLNLLMQVSSLYIV